MICPNCGLDNPPTARFCANCGTTLSGGAAPPPPPNAPYNPVGGGYNQGSQPYNMPTGGFNVGGQRMSPARAIGLGCLVLVVLFFLFTLSCARSCFLPRRHFYRYSRAIVIHEQHFPIIRA